MSKISLSNIIEELAKRNGISQSLSDSFLHAFFMTIEKGLVNDGIVKIKGFGTFKLVDVSNRGSVDVNTGARITIKGYRKVTFTPDSSVKEFVNRPFAHFEPAELSDDYPIDEELTVESGIDSYEVSGREERSLQTKTEVIQAIVLEDVSVPVMMPSVEEISEEESVKQSQQKDECLLDEKEAERDKDILSGQKTADESVVVVEQNTANESVEQENAIENDENMAEYPEEMDMDKAYSESNHHRSENEHNGSNFGCLLSVLLVLIIIGIHILGSISKDAVVNDYSKQLSKEYENEITVKPNLGKELEAEWNTKVESSTEKISSKGVTPSEPVKNKPETESNNAKKTDKNVSALPTKPTSVVQQIVLSESLLAKDIKDITIADTTEYVYDGVLTTHTLGNGETIIRLAQKYYGDKRLWPYIVKYNHVDDFNKVGIGKKIEIPKLVRKTK